MKPVYGVVVQPGTSREEKKTGWRIYRPRHKQKDCIGCRDCELMCPDGAVYRIDKKKFDADMDACKGCGICAEMCPVDDIDMVLESEGGQQDGVPGPQIKGPAVKNPDEEYGWGMIDRGGKEPKGKEPGGEAS
jgi:pyruvate ferredoxin oxidoreductase delta subunit